MYFTYILQSTSSNKFYIGHTSDINSRLERHSGNREKATKNRGPWELVYFEEFETKSLSQTREYEIKKMKSSKYIRDLILQKSTPM
jgi:putative endonuclease